jgi:hypothetical protein
MEIISVFCRWDRANDAGKREHWKQFPEDHKMLLFIPDDKMCLYDTPEAKHWPKLSQIGYAYLGSDRHSIEILTRALSTLSNDQATEAFGHIRYPRNKEVRDRLTPTNREILDSKVTTIMKSQFTNVKSDPSEARTFTATEEFLSSLSRAMQLCSSKRCIEPSQEFEEYTHFQIDECLAHSFHPGCSPTGHACADNGTNSGEAKVV